MADEDMQPVDSDGVLDTAAEWRDWFRAAGVRALKTVAQAGVAFIGSGAVFSDVNWGVAFSAMGMAGVLSLLTSVSGIPEVGGGVSVAKLASK